MGGGLPEIFLPVKLSCSPSVLSGFSSTQWKDQSRYRPPWVFYGNLRAILASETK